MFHEVFRHLIHLTSFGFLLIVFYHIWLISHSPINRRNAQRKCTCRSSNKGFLSKGLSFPRGLVLITDLLNLYHYLKEL